MFAVGQGQPFSDNTKEWILKVDNYICAYCGEPATVVDHIAPRSKGGTDDTENGVACCEDCNRRKGAKLNIRWLARAFFIVLNRDISKRPTDLQEMTAVDKDTSDLLQYGRKLAVIKLNRRRDVIKMNTKCINCGIALTEWFRQRFCSVPCRNLWWKKVHRRMRRLAA